MAARMRAHDWSATVLGRAGLWPAALVALVGVALQAATPMAVYWGPDLVILYSDAWGALVGGKHPGALGRPAREVFQEVWPELGPAFARVPTSWRRCSTPSSRRSPSGRARVSACR